MSSVLEKLQQVTDSAEIWWDSPPLDFPAWRDGLLVTAPDSETRARWGAQLERFLTPTAPEHSLVRGVTTNPSLVARSVLSAPERWNRRVRDLIRSQPLPDVEHLYTAVYQEVLYRSAAEMLPIWRASDGRYGWVSGQVDPRSTFHSAHMLGQALNLAQLAPNLMIKVPGSAQGYQVIEELVARGISINSTLSYTVSQFLACAQAVERGLARARTDGVDLSRWRAVSTHMIGRFGSNPDLRYEAAARGIAMSQTDLRWAETAIIKRIHRIVDERALPVKPLLSSLLTDDAGQGATTLSAHLEQTAGGAIVYTCKPQFIAEVMRREHELDVFRPGAIDEDVPARVLERLSRLPSFQRAYEPSGMSADEFGHFGSFISTYAEVLQNTRQLIDFVAQRIQESERSSVPITAAPDPSGPPAEPAPRVPFRAPTGVRTGSPTREKRQRPVHPSIALWSHPRSMSTALERSFTERGDFTVFHEEFAYVFFMHEERADIPHKHPDPTHPLTYTEIKELMERARERTPVFHKDFPYHVLDHLLADSDYLLGQTHTFLIRDPAEAVLSHATVHPDLTREVLGYEQLARLFDRVRELTGRVPPVINAADLAADPEGTLTAYCGAVGIPFRPEALSWGSGERPEWRTWSGWHRDVAASSGFRQPERKYRFSFEDRPQLREFVDYCTPFYARLDRFRLRPAARPSESPGKTSVEEMA